MEQQRYLRIQQDPNFQELVSKRQRFAWTLSILMLGLYLAFIMLIAFAPGWLGTPLSDSTTVTPVTITEFITNKATGARLKAAQ